MVCYQITLFVTKEQEDAIIGLFAARNWPYRKADYDAQSQQCFSPDSQSQDAPENLSQEQCAELEEDNSYIDVKPENSVVSIYANPHKADTCSSLENNYDPFTKLLSRFASVNSSSDWDTECRAYPKRLLPATKITASSEKSSNTDDETNSSTNAFPYLNITDAKKYTYRVENKTLDQPELRSDFGSDNNSEATDPTVSNDMNKTMAVFESSDNFKSNYCPERSCAAEVCGLKKQVKSETETETGLQDFRRRSPQSQETFDTYNAYVEVKVEDMGWDSDEGQEAVCTSTCLTEAGESSENPREKDYNSNNHDFSWKNVHAVKQDHIKAAIHKNFSVNSYNSDEDTTSLNSNDSYCKRLETESFHQMQLEKDVFLKKNSERSSEDSKLNVTSDMNLACPVIDISNNLKKDKIFEAEACYDTDHQVSRGRNSNSEGARMLPRKQLKVKLPANKSKAKKSAYIYCSGCEHSFKFRNRYEDHLKYDRCGHVCEFCGKVFLYNKSLDYKRHIKYHKNQRDHKCHICGKLFIERYAMLRHVKRHSCPNPVICEVCGLGFPTSTAVNLHKYHMHNNNRQKELCPKCPKTFMSKGGLFYHIRTTHNKDWNETCNICNKTFNDIKLLKAHMITHRESFDHKCDICNAAFKRVTTLYQHKRRHKKAFSHFCKFCQKGFYDGRTVQEHENLHTGAKPHVCSVCGYSCAFRSNLNKHVKLVHKNATS